MLVIGLCPRLCCHSPVHLVGNSWHTFARKCITSPGSLHLTRIHIHIGARAFRSRDLGSKILDATERLHLEIIIKFDDFYFSFSPFCRYFINDIFGKNLKSYFYNNFCNKCRFAMTIFKIFFISKTNEYYNKYRM